MPAQASRHRGPTQLQRGRTESVRLRCRADGHSNVIGYAVRQSLRIANVCCALCCRVEATAAPLSPMSTTVGPLAIVSSKEAGLDDHEASGRHRRFLLGGGTITLTEWSFITSIVARTIRPFISTTVVFPGFLGSALCPTAGINACTLSCLPAGYNVC